MARTRKLSNKLPTRKSVTTAPRQVLKVGRNEPCPCGSGKKFKACHAAEGEGYLQKLAYEEEKSRLKADRERLGVKVPWYRRLLGA